MAKLRMEITKGDGVRYIAHLDYARAVERAVRRANLPAAYSEGFNPHMKLAFASALGVGVASEAEYVDIELKQEISLHDVLTRLGGTLPKGINLKRAKYIPPSSAALMAIVNLAHYNIEVPLRADSDIALIEESINEFNGAKEVLFVRQSPKGKRDISVKEFVKDIKFQLLENKLKLYFECIITAKGTIKPSEVIEVLVDSFALPIDKDSSLINRVGLFVADRGVRLSPLDLS